MQKKTIGIVATSSPIAAECPYRFQRGITELQRCGYEVIIGTYATSKIGHTAGTPEERASDLMKMLNDPCIDIVMATIGGNNANEMLPYLDFRQIQQLKKKKVFVGYSDNTILLQTLWKHGGVSTIHGPSVLPQFGEYGGVNPFTLKSFQRVTESLDSGEPYELPVSTNWSDEYLAWDQDDIRPRHYSSNSGWWIIREGTASGRLFGGNLRTWLTLMGTKYAVLPPDAVIFIEDICDENLPSIHRMLTHLHQAGGFERAHGLLIGRFESKSAVTRQGLAFVMDRLKLKPGFPVIANLDFGHTDPMLSLPMGHMAQVETSTPKVTIQL